MHDHADLVVVGAGHAGCEAAAAAARLGLSVALVTLTLDGVARLPCNPAIGGLAKGHLVRELDALGGLMARAADASTVQFRQLNTSKGLAVRSSRAQVDVHAYPRALRHLLLSHGGIRLVEGEVTALHLEGGRAAGVAIDGRLLRSPRIVLTTGTFLGGVMHRGEERLEGGRVDERAATSLSVSLREAGVSLTRLKTGTVPRVRASTVDWQAVPAQDDVFPEGHLSFAHVARTLPPLRVHVTATHEALHELVRGALHRSPLHTGAISGTGPRYCPSLEDKVVRFPDRARHLLFLEPEGHETEQVYVGGLSTSLPQDVQERLVHAIPGLERAEILRFGYAVEYDVIDPRGLDPGLQLRAIPGLWFAGQVNGTSGYEEAAAQGLVAGASAALGEPFVVRRDQGYVGVLVDDLVTRGTGGEPYRMFTSRAEHRLILREDNADRRLMPLGRTVGLLPDADWEAFEAREEARARAEVALDRPAPARPEHYAAAGLDAPPGPRTRRELLRRADVDWQTLTRLDPDLPELPDDVAAALEIDVKYAGYVAQAERRAAAAARWEAVRLPQDIDWAGVPSLTTEARERLTRARPHTLGQAARLPGVTPAAVQAVAAWLGRTA